MKFPNSTVLIIAIILLPLSGFCQDSSEELVEKVGNGGINWTSGILDGHANVHEPHSMQSITKIRSASS